MNDIQYIETEKAPTAFGPFTQAVASGSLVYTSGALPLDPETGTLVGLTIEEQTTQTMKNLEAVLLGAGSSLEKVLFITIYLTDMEEFSRMNSIYATFFDSKYPARATIGVNALAQKAKVEIQAIALTQEVLL